MHSEVVEHVGTTLVFDTVGMVFDSVRRAQLGMALWRVTGRDGLMNLDGVDLAIVAAYGPADWGVVDALATRSPALIVTSSFSELEAAGALARGLIGYLDMSMPLESLGRALGAAARGELAYPRETVGRWLRENGRAPSPATSRASVLTRRQREVVGLIAQGAPDKEIARRLGISTATAQKHVANLLARLGVPNRAAAVAAVSYGTVPLTA